ncbi:SDR family NAD(P)-dependent oxidoreductase [Xanthomonas axonopodis]|uniref:SDR family NAD(P)-dependent oxidoreductase n=1 Tax=Xanthomonas axonopodis TaxID=53413 RepID=UPI0009960645|nr:SDR family oxidoreductase [Xanthomonas axonopodis]OOX17833.1 ketoacyl reductase [Xanthomonas axonopodis pv. bauhiniae]
MDLGIKQRIALISGGDSGMGKETARQLLEAGVRVAITDLPNGTLDQAVAELSGLGEIVAIEGDVTQEQDVIHIFLEVSDAGWLETLDINLMGAVRMCRQAIPAMRRKQWGRLVLFASEDAVQPYVDELAYCASKAGILSLAKGLSKAYGADNVLVNTVSPAFIATPMTDKMMQKRAHENGTSVEEAIASFLDEERPGMALKRRGRPEEVASVVAFLCSERASFINGAGVRVDSGSVFTIAG